MRTHYTLVEQDYDRSLIDQSTIKQEPEQEEIPARTYPSPKRSCINLLVTSYIFALFCIVSLQLVPGSYVPTFFAVIAFCLHVMGFLCLVWIDEYR